MSEDGYEETFAVNHLAHFVLTGRLLALDAFRGSARYPARVVHVSSRRHVHAKGIRWDDVMLSNGYTGLRAYDQSKLANILFSRELARRARVEGRALNSYAVHPGSVATEIVRDSGPLSYLSNKVAGWVLATPEEGARTSIYAATHPALDEVTGA